VAALLGVIDTKDVDYVAGLTPDALKGVKAGFLKADVLAQPTGDLEDTTDNATVAQVVEAALMATGASVTDVKLPSSEVLDRLVSLLGVLIDGGVRHDMVPYLTAAGAPVKTLEELAAYNLRDPQVRIPKGQSEVDIALADPVMRDPEAYAQMTPGIKGAVVEALDAAFAENQVDVLVSVNNYHGEGGPGGPGLLFISQEAGAAGIDMSKNNAATLADRDWVYFTQRGTKGAKPFLTCPAYDAINYNAALNGWTREEKEAEIVKALEGCRDKYVAEGVDFSAYTTNENAADVKDIAAALGYDKIVYYGISYGTWLGQFIMRNHPEILEAVILDGIAPAEFTAYNQISDFQASFRQVFEACKADAACGKFCPDLEAELSEVMAKLDANPALPGDIAVIELDGQELLVQSGSYLAASAGVQVDTKWSGAKTFFGGEGLIMLRVTGKGTLIVSSYGAIHPVELTAGQSYVVDTGHLVTFESHMKYQVKKVGGWKSTLFSGEGLVAELTGPGRLTLQTRSQDAFLSWLIPKLPQPPSTSSSSKS
jgi:uncharacterized protein (TIGR00266 family)